MTRHSIQTFGATRTATCPGACAPGSDGPVANLRRAFTLVEMIVVIAIIALLVGLVLPGAAAMWKQRNEAGTINTVRGLLESARSQARRSGERGLLFYVDPIDDVQRIAFIEAEPPNAPDAVGNVYDQSDCNRLTGNNPDCVKAWMAVNRFRVTSDKVYTVPQPYRVAPAAVLDWAAKIKVGATGAVDLQRRLGNDQFFEVDTAKDAMASPRHRNHFAIIFNGSGVLEVGRDVLVHDRTDAIVPPLRGDKTRLGVSDREPRQQEYRLAEDGRPKPIDPINRLGLFNMVCYNDGTVANFPSVDGLVVYDDSVTEGLASGEEAGSILVDHLLDDGRPLFVSRQTGDIIMGEKGR